VKLACLRACASANPSHNRRSVLFSIGWNLQSCHSAGVPILVPRFDPDGKFSRHAPNTEEPALRCGLPRRLQDSEKYSQKSVAMTGLSDMMRLFGRAASSLTAKLQHDGMRIFCSAV
jgi:hypothetical protein